MSPYKQIKERPGQINHVFVFIELRIVLDIKIIGGKNKICFCSFYQFVALGSSLSHTEMTLLPNFLRNFLPIHHNRWFNLFNMNQNTNKNNQLFIPHKSIHSIFRYNMMSTQETIWEIREYLSKFWIFIKPHLLLASSNRQMFSQEHQKMFIYTLSR